MSETAPVADTAPQTGDAAAFEAMASDMAGAMKSDMLGTDAPADAAPAAQVSGPLDGAPSVSGVEGGTAGEAGTLVPAESHDHAVKATFLGMDSTGWVAIGMLALIGIMLWKRVPAMITAALDARIAGIRQQLDQAKALRAEAEALKAEYEARRVQAEKDAADIVAHARLEAETLLADARTQTEAMVARRTRMAEDRIAAAERAAEHDVRSITATVATDAARAVLAQRLSAGQPDRLVDQAIAELDRKLH